MGKSEWKPAETAPKDGTWVLVYGEPWDDKPPYWVSRWVSETEEWWEQVDETTCKLTEKDSSHWEGWNEPTHWMPLPPEPSEE